MNHHQFSLLLVSTFFSGLSISQAFNGNNVTKNSQYCTMDDLQGSPGIITKQLSDCPVAISNLRAGIHPTLVIKNKQTLICCPNEERISSIKCKEYSAFESSISSSEKAYPASKIISSSVFNSGKDALMGQLPHMVAIGYCKSGRDNADKNFDCEYKCSGTLISEDYVLSAASCVTITDKPRIVLLGDTDLKRKPQGSRYRKIAFIQNIIAYPRKISQYHDIVLFQLAKPVKLSKFIRPACLPQPEDRLELQQEHLLSTGEWEYILKCQNIDTKLKIFNLKRINQKTCKDLIEELPDRAELYPLGILRSQFCASDSKGLFETQNTCNGNIGAGIVMDHSLGSHNDKEMRNYYYVMGIRSIKPIDCSGAHPVVYTNVQSYLDWIERVVWP